MPSGERARLANWWEVEVHKQVGVRYGRQSLDEIDMSVLRRTSWTSKALESRLGGRSRIGTRSIRVCGVHRRRCCREAFLGVDPLGKTMQIDDHGYIDCRRAEKKGSYSDSARPTSQRYRFRRFRKSTARATVNISIRGREGLMQQAQDQSRLVMRRCIIGLSRG